LLQKQSKAEESGDSQQAWKEIFIFSAESQNKAKTRIFGLLTFAQKKLRLGYLSGRTFKKNTS